MRGTRARCVTTGDTGNEEDGAGTLCGASMLTEKVCRCAEILDEVAASLLAAVVVGSAQDR